MSAYKQFLSSDIVISPFEVNKSFSFEGDIELEDPEISINRFLGKNIGGLFDPLTDPTTGYNNSQYQRLVYNSIKELYYSNYLSSSYGDNVNTSSILPGSTPEGDVLVGTTPSSGRYFNYNQSTLTFNKSFPTSSDSIIGVMSIPSRLFGNYIQPSSFTWVADSGSIYDDGEGNLIYEATGNICGQIFYPHGLAIITSDNTPGNGYGAAIYGSSIYGIGNNEIIENFIETNNITCSFSSSLNIIETQYKCTISENDYNFTLNPSTTSGSTNITSSIGTFYTPGQYLNDNITGSEFNPYVTTVGLYNENQELLAIGKLSQPLPTSPTTDTTILINIDR